MAEEHKFLDSGVLQPPDAPCSDVPLADGDGFRSAQKPASRGSGVEFAEYRNYVPGDDIRRLDWRVLRARTRFLKDAAETNLRCYFVLDCSGSMKFGNKFDYAKRFAGNNGLHHGAPGGRGRFDLGKTF